MAIGPNEVIRQTTPEQGRTPFTAPLGWALNAFDAMLCSLVLRFSGRSKTTAGGFSGERPDLGDALGGVDPVQVEGRQREDLACRAVRVRQDLSRVRGFAEEVALAFAGLEAVRKIAHATLKSGGAHGRGHGRREKDQVRPEGQHCGQCSGCCDAKEKGPLSGASGVFLERGLLRGGRRRRGGRLGRGRTRGRGPGRLRAGRGRAGRRRARRRTRLLHHRRGLRRRSALGCRRLLLLAAGRERERRRGRESQGQELLHIPSLLLSIKSFPRERSRNAPAEKRGGMISDDEVLSRTGRVPVAPPARYPPRADQRM